MMYVEVTVATRNLYVWFRNVEEIHAFIDTLTAITGEVGITYSMLLSSEA